jgi:hypothetical protein
MAREASFDSVSPHVSASTREEEPWLMNAGPLMLEEYYCRLDDANVRVLSVEVVRSDLDMKREAHEPALEAGARLGARAGI